MEEPYPEPEKNLEHFEKVGEKKLGGMRTLFSIALIFLTGFIEFMTLVIMALSAAFGGGRDTQITALSSVLLITGVFEIIALFALLLNVQSLKYAKVLDIIFGGMIFLFGVYVAFNGSSTGATVVGFTSIIFFGHALMLQKFEETM